MVLYTPLISLEQVLFASKKLSYLEKFVFQLDLEY